MANWLRYALTSCSCCVIVAAVAGDLAKMSGDLRTDSGSTSTPASRPPRHSNSDDNQGDAEPGLNFTYGVDWYPIDPVIVSGVIDWGQVSAASLFHGRATIGLVRDGWRDFTGYDYFRISDSDTHSWILGVERRF